MAKTPSEELFEEYLIEKGLVPEGDFCYEPNLGKKRPIDFYIKNINTLFEVTAFDRANPQDKLLLGTRRTHAAVKLNPYVQVRNKIREKGKQLREYKNDYSCVLILHKGDSITAGLEIELLAGSIFGDISMKFSSDGAYVNTFFGKNGKLSRLKNTTFSAIAVLEETFPDRKTSGKRFWETHDKHEVRNLNFENLTILYNKWSTSEGYDLEKRVILLRVILNPFARKPIQANFFDGPLDEVFSVDESGRFTQQK